jgi:hypothetical protein
MEMFDASGDLSLDVDAPIQRVEGNDASGSPHELAPWKEKDCGE